MSLTNKETKKTGTVIKSCVCNNEYMDKKYGQGQRVHNIAMRGDKSTPRCVVCSKEK